MTVPDSSTQELFAVCTDPLAAGQKIRFTDASGNPAATATVIAPDENNAEILHVDYLGVHQRLNLATGTLMCQHPRCSQTMNHGGSCDGEQELEQ